MNGDQIRESLRRADSGAVDEFERLVRLDKLSRRDLIRRGIALGLAAPAIAGILAACGGGSSSPTTSASATGAATTVPAGGATATSAPSGAVSPAATVSGSPAASAPISTGKKGGSGTLVVSQSGDPKSFNPDFQIDDNGYISHSNIYNTMVVLDDDYNIIPELCSDWKVADDGLSITFHLVPNAKWHDGQTVTSADCKYTIDQILAQKGAPGQDNLSAIDSVETPDDKTVVFKLKAPSAPLLGFLGWYGTFILPKHIYDGTDWTKNPANQNPVGSGPFKFVSYKSGDNITLEANKDYWGEGPYLDKLIFRIIPDANTATQAFLNGEVDFMNSPTPPLSQVSQLEQTPGVKVQTKAFPSVYYIGCNMQKEPTSKPEVRKAISQAIDRQQMVSKALSGFGSVATTFYTDAIAWAADKDPDAQVPQYDKAAAAAALDAAGYPANGGSRFKLTFPYFTASPQYGDIATVVKEQLAAINVNVDLVALEIGAWQDRTQKGDYDISLLDGFQGPDPANLKLRVGTGGAVNFWFYSNKDVDALLGEGAKLTDQKARAEKYFAVERQLAKDLPIIPLAGVKAVRPYHDNITGLYFTDDVKGKVGLNRFTLTKVGKK